MRAVLVLALLAFAAVAAAHPPVGVAPVAPPTTPRSTKMVPVTSWVDDVRAQLGAARLDGWLLYDYRGLNPLALEVVHPRAPQRRWFYLIPVVGEPQLLVHADDAAAFDVPKPLVYRTWRELDAQLKLLLRGKKRVAMESSSRLPSWSRVDAGTVELVRAAGAQQVTSSGDLVTLLHARWSDAQEKSHRAAAAALVAIKDDAFTFIGRGQGRVTEYDAQQLILRGFIDRGLESSELPVVAAGAHSADPAFVPTPERSERIKPGDVVLVSLAARVRGSDGVYADQTWVGFVGDHVPDEVERAFAAVRDARDRAVAFVEERLKKKSPPRGFEVDDAARAVLAKAGVGERMLGRTGHSLGTRRFADGPDLDDNEVRDERTLLPKTGYVVEPGVYTKGAVGLRSAVDVFLLADGVHVTPETPQREVELIRAAAK